ncbi:MAG TPA: lantibiotic dehydratase, partial [Bryobacteraceae bacterium]|nr:lantibiotic dehydratase [Bryobacteraceae bacterium]
MAPWIFRIASWPIDITNSLRSTDFACAVDDVLAKQEIIRARSEELSARLHSEVPRLNPLDRRLALRVRRALHRTTEPVNAGDLAALVSISAGAECLLADNRERQRLARRLEELRTQYSAVLKTETEALARIAGESRFRRALAVASPSTSGAWERTLSGGRLPDNWRLKSTLLNYVMRAAGRATPNGLWSGVALESPHDGDELVSVRTVEAEIFAKPDVNVFFELFEAASSAPHYRQAVWLRWNPTLTRLPDGAWACARCEDGEWVMVRMTDDDGSIRSLRTVMHESDQMDFDQLRAAVEISEEALDRLYAAGILCAAWDREGAYENWCAALEALVACLRPGEQLLWRTAIRDLCAICESLRARGNDPAVEPVRLAMARARGIVNDLRLRYGAALYPDDRSVLFFDQTAGFEIGVSDELRNRIADVIRRCLDFDRGGMGELLAREGRKAAAAKAPADVALALAGISVVRDEPAAETASQDFAGGYRALLEEWTRDIEPESSEHIHRLGVPQPASRCPVGPGAALIVPGATPGGVCVRVGSIAPDWGAFYGRFHHLFAAAGKRSFERWIKRSKAFVEAAGVELADVALRGTHDRNAALRPRLGGRILDPFSRQLADLTAVFDPESGCSLQDGDGKPVLPVLHSAVETSRADPWSRWFAEVEGHAGRPSLLAPPPPLPRELDVWKHCPRLFLDSTTVISPERWWCPQETADELRRVTGFDRFVSWRRWVKRAGIPDRV